MRTLVYILMGYFLPVCTVISHAADARGRPPEAFSDLPAFVLPADLYRMVFDFPALYLEELDQLEEEWKRLTKTEDASTEEWEHLAVQFFIHHEFERIPRIYEQVQRTNGDVSVDLLHVLALSHEALEEWEPAFQVWQQLHVQQPDAPLPLTRMAVNMMHRGHREEVIALLRKGRRRFPEHSPIAHLLSALYWQQGEQRAAWRTLARVAVRTDVPRDFLLFLAWLSAQDNQAEVAVGWLRQALASQTPDTQQRILSMDAWTSLRPHDAFGALATEFNWTPETAQATSLEGAEDEAVTGLPVFPLLASMLTNRMANDLQISVRLEDESTDIPLEFDWEAGESPALGLRTRTPSTIRGPSLLPKETPLSD